nr:immunoglobulin heavy chain junction region [Macaca mulatta]
CAKHPPYNWIYSPPDYW